MGATILRHPQRQTNRTSLKTKGARFGSWLGLGVHHVPACDDWRRIVTRYDKLARNYLSGEYLAAAFLLAN